MAFETQTGAVAAVKTSLYKTAPRMMTMAGDCELRCGILQRACSQNLLLHAQSGT